MSFLAECEDCGSSIRSTTPWKTLNFWATIGSIGETQVRWRTCLECGAAFGETKEVVF